jgi:GDP-D-mannose 3', 5'-epimerase
MNSDIDQPINLGSSELVTIDRLVDIVEEIAGIQLERTYDLNAPKGVNGRNSDNSLILDRLGWEPSIRLVNGLERTYRWIEREMAERSAQSEQKHFVHSPAPRIVLPGLGTHAASEYPASVSTRSPA